MGMCQYNHQLYSDWLFIDVPWKWRMFLLAEKYQISISSFHASLLLYIFLHHKLFAGMWSTIIYVHECQCAFGFLKIYTCTSVTETWGRNSSAPCGKLHMMMKRWIIKFKLQFVLIQKILQSPDGVFVIYLKNIYFFYVSVWIGNYMLIFQQTKNFDPNVNICQQ